MYLSQLNVIFESKFISLSIDYTFFLEIALKYSSVYAIFSNVMLQCMLCYALCSCTGLKVPERHRDQSEIG